MVLTRQEAKVAFNHIMDNVLGHGDKTPLKSALQQESIEDIFALVTIDDSNINGLTFEDPSNADNHLPIPKGDKNLVRIFRDYVIHRNTSGDPVNDNWTSVTQTDFDAFRINPAYVATFTRAPHGIVGATSSQPAAMVTSASTSAAKKSPAELFRRGIKRDPTLFPTLKDEKLNDSWHRSFANQARAQDLSDVLDPNYRPSSTEDRDLFVEKQKFLYAVLESKVLTDHGKAIIRQHDDDFDAQTVYRKLQEHHLRSTQATIDSSSILSYITSARLGNGEWRGSTTTFILHWQDQVRLYERQVELSDHFSDGQKRIMLENAVYPIAELRQVKINADLEKTRTKRDLTYSEYVSLLLSAAAAYDNQFKTKRERRQVLNHEWEDAYDDASPNNDPYDIDAPVSIIQANAHDRRIKPSPKPNSQRVRMPRDRWFHLSDKDRQVWDQLDEKSKAIILGISAAPGDRSLLENSNRRVNLHEMSAFDFLQAQVHDLVDPDHPDTDDPTPPADESTHCDLETDSDTRLVNAAKSSKSNLAPGDIRRVMSQSSKRQQSINATHIVYDISAHRASSSLSLVDRGANGGLAGTDVRIIHRTHRFVDIRGIDNHQLTEIPIGTVGGVVDTQKGPIIAIMHQYALLGKGTSIHSPGQLEWFKNEVNDRSIKTGGLQCITTLDGYIIPLVIQDGLPRMAIRPYTDTEWDTLPHVFLTGESDWDPSVLDHEFGDEQWADALGEEIDTDPITNAFDEFGNYRHRVIIQHADFFARQSIDDNLDDVIDRCVYHAQFHAASAAIFYNAHEHESEIPPAPLEDAEEDPTMIISPPCVTSASTRDYHKLRPLFGWLSTDVIKETFAHTTQYARLPSCTLLKRSFKSANPALNVQRRNESVACDIVYADEPAIDDGSTAAVLFVGLDTQVTDIYGIKRDKQFVNTLEDNIRQRGAPNKLISDRAQVEISNKVLQILRALCIGDWQSEPHQQQQNPAERRYQTIKNTANRILDRTGAPAYTWLLCLTYVCYLLNHTYNASIHGVPLTHLTGVTVDISPLLRFHFWEKVYYKAVDTCFPSESTEATGYIVGISEHCGPALTWKILTANTNKVIYRSQVRSCSDDDPNIRADMFGGEDTDPIHDPIIKSRHELSGEEAKQVTTSPVFNPEDLIGRSFLMDQQEDGQRFRARIVKLLEDHESSIEENPTRIKFLCSLNNDQAEEIITYNKLLEYITRDEETDIVWKFRRIVSHQGPLKHGHHDFKGSTYNVMVEWENGEVTAEPLHVIAADDPVTCAIYAKENNLLDQPGWKRFKAIAKRQKKFTRMVNQAKLRSYHMAPRFKYGFEVPRDYVHAMQLDERNKDTRWRDAIALELLQIDEYQTFHDLGHHTKANPPAGYKKIRVHLVFDVKHDGRHRARLVADGHLTPVPLESVYSGVVSLRGFRMVIFLAELNNLKMWSTDIGSAYLEASTSEKVYIVAGPEFGDREGHILIIDKALYGLRSSGARWHDKFSDCLRDLGFQPCKAEPDIWLRRNGDIYEYIAVYVDDLALALVDPQEFVDTLQTKYKFKFKGTGPITFHLGMDFFRDDDGTLCMAPHKYIVKMIANYERIFGELPKRKFSSPIEKGDHPELDTSELLDSQGIATYQSLIGALQWVITIGRFDVITAVMTLSGFRAAPRRGHLERIKRVYGYLSKMQHAIIRVRTEEPDYSDVPDIQYDWSRSVYGKLEEMKPTDAPEPLGRFVTLTHYVDANLMHDVVTGRSVTGILHFLNKTPMDWFAKKQATVETATYGSEFVAARICIEQIIDLRTTLRYLGVPIREKSYMFGDNQSVVNSSMQVHAKLHKRHNILSFHRVREAIAAGIVTFQFIPGHLNPADILSKHWGYSQIWNRLKALLFWHGDTANILDSDDATSDKRGVTKSEQDCIGNKLSCEYFTVLSS